MRLEAEKEIFEGETGNLPQLQGLAVDIEKAAAFPVQGRSGRENQIARTVCIDTARGYRRFRERENDGQPLGESSQVARPEHDNLSASRPAYGKQSAPALQLVRRAHVVIDDFREERKDAVERAFRARLYPIERFHTGLIVTGPKIA